MPRFAILAHDHPAPHWDLFLEAGAVLRSWRLLAPLAAGLPVPAESAAEHRLAYLEYEGPVSGGRGSVSRLDGGEFGWEADTPDRLLVRLTGQRFIGRLALQRVGEAWSCTFDPG
jgi:hypothetical protein